MTDIERKLARHTRQIVELTERVASLEKVAHAPVDLRPVIRGELKELLTPVTDGSDSTGFIREQLGA